MRDPSNWVRLDAGFAYERSLSDYIVAYPHRLEDGLIPYPDSKVREKVFPDRTRLDVLLMDRDGHPVVVECKQHSPTVADIRQLQRYVEHVAEQTGSRHVRGSWALQEAPAVTRTRMVFRKADLVIGKGGVETKETASSGPIAIDEKDIELPDVVTDLQDRTQLTRRSIVRILRESGRLSDFARNPQEFIELAADAINRCKRLALVDGIKYQRIGEQAYYAQELFQQEELTDYLKQTLETKKSVYERVVYDSAGVERTFAQEMEQNEAVKVYAKLPGWFRVPTPLGSYSPDWAVLVQREGEVERLYFVVETKGSLFAQDLRVLEGTKIACGKRHFEALAVK